MGDTAHSNLGHLVRCSNKDRDTTKNSKMFEKQSGGTPHIPFEGIRSDVQNKVGTPSQVGTARLRSRVGGRLVKSDFYQSLAWIQVVAEHGKNGHEFQFCSFIRSFWQL